MEKALKASKKHTRSSIAQAAPSPERQTSSTFAMNNYELAVVIQRGFYIQQQPGKV